MVTYGKSAFKGFYCFKFNTLIYTVVHRFNTFRYNEHMYVKFRKGKDKFPKRLPVETHETQDLRNIFGLNDATFFRISILQPEIYFETMIKFTRFFSYPGRIKTLRHIF